VEANAGLLILEWLGVVPLVATLPRASASLETNATLFTRQEDPAPHIPLPRHLSCHVLLFLNFLHLLVASQVHIIPLQNIPEIVILPLFPTILLNLLTINHHLNDLHLLGMEDIHHILPELFHQKNLVDIGRKVTVNKDQTAASHMLVQVDLQLRVLKEALPQNLVVIGLAVVVTWGTNVDFFIVALLEVVVPGNRMELQLSNDHLFRGKKQTLDSGLNVLFCSVFFFELYYDLCHMFDQI